MEEFESKVGSLTAPGSRELLGVMVSIINTQGESLVKISYSQNDIEALKGQFSISMLLAFIHWSLTRRR
jgi:hypothetical protein